jgi:antitoxin ParD1/3/4
MSSTEQMMISVPPDVAAELRASVDVGEYHDLAEIVRDALLGWHLSRQLATDDLGELRSLIQEGIDSGPGVDADEVFDALRAQYAASDTV